ncbi:MAG: NADPH-dependent F420 reductase [Bryobacterales bacterium]|nr:NADPH-dependent F420 reductase [Bryobacterales bacterium]
MNIAFLGYGNVGAPLADHLQRAGHEVTLAAHSAASESVQKALARNASLKVSVPKRAVAAAEVVFLATPFAANETAIASVADEIHGKIIVDCTNPVGPGLTHGLNNALSGSEALQKLAPRSHVVKAFTIYGYENFQDNSFPGYNVKPAMMFCGNDQSAKQTVSRLIADLGWEPLDTGGLEQALHLEHLTLLWIRMVRVHGAPSHMVWAVLRR